MAGWETFEGTVTVTVAGVYDIGRLAISGVQASYPHTGKAIEPIVNVAKRNAALAIGTDYNVSYTGNTAAGTAHITLTGLGAYAGSEKTTDFVIVDPALYLLGYRAWDTSYNASKNFAEITSTLSPTTLLGDNGVGGGVSTQNLALTFNQPVTITDADALIAQVNISFKTEEKDTTVSIDPADPNTVIFKMRDKAGVLTAQANSSLTASPVHPSRYLNALVATANANEKAYFTYNIATIQPTGLALEKTAGTLGTTGTPASVTYRISSLPLVRSMNFLRFAADGVPVGASGYFTIHSHTFYAMDAATHVASLVTAANIATFDAAGYILADNGDGSFTVTAKVAKAGESLDWAVWAYPYRSAADAKLDLAKAIKTSAASDAVKAEAYNLIKDPAATVEQIAGIIENLGKGAEDTNKNDDGKDVNKKPDTTANPDNSKVTDKDTANKVTQTSVALKKISITKVKVGKKRIKITWKKAATAQNINGYQIRYKVKGASKWKTKTVSAKKQSLTIKKLKKGKKYQIKVRSYRTVNKVRQYGPWSKTKISGKIK
jgi:hypothetical protein